jgi:hypothetical protein
MADAQVTQKTHIVTLAEALRNLCAGVKTQSQRHIRALHSYCATRLVLEGGFPPEWVIPRQGFSSDKVNNSEYRLHPSPEVEDTSEHRILGGIKYKDVDVTVLVPGLGPALAVSGKSTGNAFRNLTNRMEEALGECTNIHLMYPGLVFGFLHLIKFAKESEVGSPQDASFDVQGRPLPAIQRYHDVMVGLSGRSTITDSGMRYEAVGLVVYQCVASGPSILKTYPPADSPVHFSKFFGRLYDLYDLRFGYPDPDGPNIRKVWHPQFADLPNTLDKNLSSEWQPRLSE